MKVSVIVTAKNEEANIANCLESIKAQTYLSNLCNRSSNLSNHSTERSEVEIIVVYPVRYRILSNGVDNNSTDKTKEIAKRYTDKVYNFGPERSAQRNFRVKQAKGKYLLYLDEDMVLFENIIFES